MPKVFYIMIQYLSSTLNNILVLYLVYGIMVTSKSDFAVLRYFTIQSDWTFEFDLSVAVKTLFFSIFNSSAFLFTEILFLR